MTARNIAYKVLLDIEKNSNYSNIALNKFLKDSKLTNKDRGLATEIVYGVVANKRTLDYMINKKNKSKKDESLSQDNIENGCIPTPIPR